MITVQKENLGKVINLKMNGSFDETVDLFTLVTETAPEMNIDCRGIKRINSTGVKNWINFFQTLSAKGVAVHFHNCSTAIIDQFNLVANFNAGGTVESLDVPYSCVSCEIELVSHFKVADLHKIQFKLPEGKCAKCSDKVVFDDDVNEYFGFLMRLK
jgi:anti-anti-sigma regulatory factor